MPAFKKIPRDTFKGIEISAGVLTTYQTDADKQIAKEAHESSIVTSYRTSESMMASSALSRIAKHF